MKMPQGWDTPTQVTATATTEKTEVQAKIDMSAEVVGKGLCAECKQPMVKAHVGGTPVWTCVKDRIALPVENDSES
jgi:hypothetical protein